MGHGVADSAPHRFVRRGPLGFEAIIARLDAHFYGLSRTTSTTGARSLKTGEILAISGNWLDAFVDHLGKERRCVGAERGETVSPSLILVAFPESKSIRCEIRLMIRNSSGEFQRSSAGIHWLRLAAAHLHLCTDARRPSNHCHFLPLFRGVRPLLRVQVILHKFNEHNRIGTKRGLR